MKDSMRDKGVPERPMAEATSDYFIREIEARLDRRIEALEAQRDRMRWMARLAGGGFVVALLALGVVLQAAFGDGGAVTARSVVAEEFVLQDANGSRRGRLAADEDGRVQFSLSDRDGRGRIRLTVLADGSPGVTISDADARPRAVLGYLPDGTTNLVFADAQGMSRAVLGVEPDGSTHALFSDRAGRIRTLVGVGADGVPSVSVLDGDQSSGSPDAR
jgi:hypothetical protein